jgi:hypothetical protein
MGVNSDVATNNQRCEARISLNSVSLPFCGSHIQGGFSFQYFLVDASPNGIQINIPEWVVNWNRLREGDDVHFALPLMVGGKLLNRGRIRWLKCQAETREQFCGATIQNPGAIVNEACFTMVQEGEIRFQTPVYCASLKDYCAEILKDTALLKKGILIYLDHLMPFFARITQNPGDYPEFRGLLFGDIREQVQKHADLLKELSEKVQNAPDFFSGFSNDFDLEQIRAIMESELSQDVFHIAFEKDSILVYLEEIHHLEARVFTNYNALVLAQILALELKTPGIQAP